MLHRADESQAARNSCPRLPHSVDSRFGLYHVAVVLSFLRSPALQKFELFIFFYRSCVYMQHFRCAVPRLLPAYFQNRQLWLLQNLRFKLDYCFQNFLFSRSWPVSEDVSTPSSISPFADVVSSSLASLTVGLNLDTTDQSEFLFLYQMLVNSQLC